MRLRKQNLKIFLVVGSVLLTYLVCEAVYRAKEYHRLNDPDFTFLMVPQDLYDFDAEVGYRYKPNLDFTATWIYGQNSGRQSQVHLNNLGLRMKRDVPEHGNATEFTIAVLGDSLTACLHNDVPWTDLLESRLNKDPKFRAATRKKIRVLNFGLDGLGLVQFPAVLKNRVLPLQPDLILVNFITADIYRRFTWRIMTSLPEATLPYRTMLGCTSLPAELSNPDCAFSNVFALPLQVAQEGTNLKTMQKEAAIFVATQRNWFTPYPEFLSSILGGKLETLLGQNPYLPLSATIGNRNESLEVSAAAIEKMQTLSKKTVFLHLPTYWEIIHQAIPGLVGELFQRLPTDLVTPMIAYLPQNPTQEEINSWINYPLDMHWSDKGAGLYAEAVHALLSERISNTVIASGAKQSQFESRESN